MTFLVFKKKPVDLILDPLLGLFIGSWQRVLIFFIALGMLVSLIKKSKYYFGRIERQPENILVHASYGWANNISERFALSLDNAALIVHPSRYFHEDAFTSLRQSCRKNKINLYEYKIFYWNFRFFFSCIYFVLLTIFCISKMKLHQIELSILLRTLKHSFDEKLLLKNLKFKLFISDDDYSPAHFIRTKMLNSSNIKHIGIQHSSGNGIYGGGSIAYMYYDLYLTWNAFTYFNFKHYWQDLEFKVKEIGYRRIDSVINKYKKLNEVKKIKNEINNNFFQRSNNLINILITLPTYINQDQFNEDYINSNDFIDGLKSTAERHIDNINFIVRPKYGHGQCDFDYLKQVFKSHNLIICDSRKYETSDLIVWADWVIASNGSGIIIEACLLNRQVLTFDYIGVICNLWSIFGKDMCISNKLQLTRVINDIADGQALDIDHSKLTRMMISEQNNKPVGKLIQVT